MATATPLGEGEFAALMARFAPLPDPPRLAVALSGGPDSLALTHLLADWCRARGGSLLALTVDHGLRPDSRTEARQVGCRLAAAGIAHRILTWRDGKALRASGSALQAPARAARYALLAAACRRAGLLHLALAHQAEDQAETLLLRLLAESGPFGLAAMEAAAPRADLLLLRPLLGVPRARLEATLRARGLDWIEDPANRDPRHRRVALRQAAPALAAHGLDGGTLGEAAQTFGRLRRAFAPLAAALLARCVAWHPAGFARLDPAPLRAAPALLVQLVVGEVLRVLGGGGYPPGRRALAALCDCLTQEPRRGRTLGGCRLVALQQEWLVVREAAGLPCLPLVPGERLQWDGRFAVTVPRRARSGLFLQGLGEAGWRRLAGELAPAPLPGPVLWSLPALFDAEGPCEVPALSWRRPGRPASGVRLRFAPQPPAGRFAFTVA